MSKEQTNGMETGYRAAHEAAVFIDRSNLGMLKFTGETRLDLINRMSTQKVIGLQDGQGTATVLTTEIGRIIDRLILYATSDAVYCLTGENNNDNIARYLMRFVFFMDDFHIEDLTADTFIFGVYGCKAGQMLAGLFTADIAGLPRHHWRQTEYQGTAVYLHKTDPIAGDGYFVMGRTKDQAAIQAALQGGGIVPIDEELFDYLRIESGQPRFGRELTTDYIPLEANLWDDVSFNKGCYTGQEIIARMESRGRIAKQLVRLSLEAPVGNGTELKASGKKAGTVTSIAEGPQGAVALAYVKSVFLENGDTITAEDIPARIIPYAL
jgi:tRNA-modifying protein YgfZ